MAAASPIQRWLNHHLPPAAADEAAAMADTESARWVGISLVARVSPPAALKLQECGVPLDTPLPLLSEMVSARGPTSLRICDPIARRVDLRLASPLFAAVSNHPAVAALRPKHDGDGGGLPEAARALLDRPAPAAPIDPATPPRVLLLLARYREDVRWLSRLPAGVTFHVVQKGGALQPELPQARTVAVPTMAAHAYYGDPYYSPSRRRRSRGRRR